MKAPSTGLSMRARGVAHAGTREVLLRSALDARFVYYHHVVRRRVERARELLLTGRAIVEVAAEVGFASQSHLNAHIRRAFGCTPSQLVGQLPSST